MFSSLPASFTPSVIMMVQNGQATAATSAPVSRISWVRLRFTRGPFSSCHMRPPPAPQQKPCCLLRFISISSPVDTASKIARGAS